MRTTNLLTIKDAAKTLKYTYRGFWGALDRGIKAGGLLPCGVYDIAPSLGITSKRILRINLQEFLYSKQELPTKVILSKINALNCCKSLNSSYFYGLSNKTKACYSRAVFLLKEFFGDKEIAQASLYEFITFLRLDKKLKDISIKKYLKALNIIFKQSHIQGFIKHNPLFGFEKNLLKEELRIEYLRKHEREALIKANATSDPYIANMIDFAIETGLRKGEQLSLTWNNVDLINKEIYITQTKTKQNRVVPLSPKALAILTFLKRQQHEKPFVDITFERWKKALQRASIRQSFRWHDLRHTFGTWCVKGWHNWLERPLNLQQTATFMGHANIKMTTRYAHLNVADIKKLILTEEEDGGQMK